MSALAPLVALVSVLLRLGPLLLLLPTARSLTGRMLWAALAALLLAPVLQPQMVPPMMALPWLLREAALGLSLGLFAAAPFLATGTAGALLALPDPIEDRVEGPQRPLRALVLLACAAAFVGLGGPRLFVLGLTESYQQHPLWPAPPTPGEPLIRAVLLQVARLPALALPLVAPLWSALLFVEVALALLRRALGAGVDRKSVV